MIKNLTDLENEVDNYFQSKTREIEQELSKYFTVISIGDSEKKWQWQHSEINYFSSTSHELKAYAELHSKFWRAEILTTSNEKLTCLIIFEFGQSINDLTIICLRYVNIYILEDNAKESDYLNEFKAYMLFGVNEKEDEKEWLGSPEMGGYESIFESITIAFFSKYKHLSYSCLIDDSTVIHSTSSSKSKISRILMTKTQINFRIDQDLLQIVKEVAAGQGIGYTDWIINQCKISLNLIPEALSEGRILDLMDMRLQPLEEEVKALSKRVDTFFKENNKLKVNESENLDHLDF